MGEIHNRMSQDRARARLAQYVVSYVFDIPLDELVAATRRSPRIAFARQVAMYLAHVAFQLSLARVAIAFGRDRSTAAHACHRIEDCRDDARLDACLDDLEAFLRSAPCPDMPQPQELVL